jgi:uncharacterized protein (TIGR02145 family)
MRRFVLIGLLIYISVHAPGQNYFIGFSASGDTNQIGTIQVVNLSTFDTVYLNGSDTLNLTSWAVGQKKQHLENCKINLVPNPFLLDAILMIKSNTGGSAIVSVHDISGRIITSKEEMVNHGETQFRLSGFPKGSYILRVNGKEIRGSINVISNGIENRPAIHKISNKTEGDSIKIPGRSIHATTQLVQMTYQDGERLQYRGQTSSFRNLAVDVPTTSKIQNFHFLSCFDNVGNHYETVEIRVPDKKKINATPDTTYTQTWMAENLNAGEFRTSSQGFHNDTIIEKFCYDNDTLNCNIYGGLYKWDEMMMYQTIDSVQGICPEGWRLPTQGEWKNLADYNGGVPFLMGDSIVGGKMKEVGTSHWTSPNLATNETGFTATGSGVYANGMQGWGFYSLGTDGVYWTSTQHSTDPTLAMEWSMFHSDEIAWNFPALKTDAYAVRCIHD